MMTAESNKWEEAYKSIFKAKNLDKNIWLDKAKDLLDAASLLEKEVLKVWDAMRKSYNNGSRGKLRTGYFATYYMLLAYAIENILKAKIVSIKCLEFKEKIDDSGRLPEELKSHDLYDLAKRLDISLNLKEESYLKRLSRSAVWTGRYPAPIKFEDLMGREYSDGEIHEESFFTRGEIKEIKKLINKLYKA